MPLIIFFLLFISVTANAQKMLVESISPFTPDGKIENVESSYSTNKETHKIESGSISGVSYSFYYSDGSGTFAGTLGNLGNLAEKFGTNWNVACKKDQITDRKHCYMNMKDLWVFVYSKNEAKVAVGDNHFPGSTIAIRFDNGAAVISTTEENGSFSSQRSSRLIQQLKKSRLVTTRFMKWPNRSWNDESWDLYGFNEAFQYINWAVQHIK
jgi:hypothetical protein